MLTEADIKALKGISPKQYAVSKYALVFGVILSLYAAVHNFYLAIHYPSLDGMSFSETVEIWNETTVLERYYSGYIVESKHRLNMSILGIGQVVLFSMLLWFIGSIRQRNNRILSELIKCGSLEK
jgi:hypothetical protein